MANKRCGCCERNHPMVCDGTLLNVLSLSHCQQQLHQTLSKEREDDEVSSRVSKSVKILKFKMLMKFGRSIQGATTLSAAEMWCATILSAAHASSTILDNVSCCYKTLQLQCCANDHVEGGLCRR